MNSCNSTPDPIYTCADLCKCITIKSPDKSIRVIRKGCEWSLEINGNVPSPGGQTYVSAGQGITVFGLGTQLNPYTVSIQSTLLNNWNTAYLKSLTDVTFDTTTGNLTFTKQDATTIVTSLDGRYVTSASGPYHKQGGNAYGTLAVIGTTDDFDVNFIRGNTSRVTLGQRGLDLYPGVSADVTKNEWGFHIDAWDGTDKVKGAYLGVTSSAYDAQSMPWLTPATTFLGYRQDMYFGTYNNTNWTLKLGSDYKAIFGGNVIVPLESRIGTPGDEGYIELAKTLGAGPARTMNFFSNDSDVAAGFRWVPHPTIGTQLSLSGNGLNINLPDGIQNSSMYHIRIQASNLTNNVRGGMSIWPADGNAMRIGVGNGSGIGNIIMGTPSSLTGRTTICGTGLYYDLGGPSYAHSSGSFLPVALNSTTYRFETITSAQLNSFLGGTPWYTSGNTLTGASIIGGTSGNFDISFVRNNVTFQTYKTAGIRYDTNQAIGTDAVVNAHIYDTKAIGGATDSYGQYINGQIATGVTNNAYYYRSNATSIAGASTTHLYHYAATQGTLSGTITNQYGLYIGSTLVGATNNYGIYSDIPSGTNRWNLYASGTAQNQLTGNTGIGGAPDSTEKLRITGNLITTVANAYSTGNFAPLARNTTTGRFETLTSAQIYTFLGGTPWYIGGNTVAADGDFGTNAAFGLNIRTNSTTRIAIANTGAVTASTQWIHTLGGESIQVKNSSATNWTGTIGFYGDNTSQATQTAYIGHITGGTGNFNIFTTGTRSLVLSSGNATTTPLYLYGQPVMTGIPIDATSGSMNPTASGPVGKILGNGYLFYYTAAKLVDYQRLELPKFYYSNGGNSFGTSATLGTGDANSLALITNGTARISITSAGAVTMPLTSGLGVSFTATSGNTFTLSNDAAFTGDIIRAAVGASVIFGVTYQGRMSIGATVPGGGTTFNNSVRLANSTAPEAFYSQGIVGATVTSSATYYKTLANTEVATTLSAGIYHYSATQGTFGAGSSITNQYGYFVDSTLIGATNNYGFHSNIAASTGRWNFYAAGSAANQFTGRTGIGGAPDTTEILKVTGNIISGAPTYSSGDYTYLVRNTTSGRFENISSIPGFATVEVTTTSQAASINTKYIANNAAPVTITLPVTAALGEQILVRGKGAGGWIVAQNSGQTIHSTTGSSTTGTGGSISSSDQYGTVTLECITANTEWLVVSQTGTLIIV